VTYAIERLQNSLPFNPQGLDAVAPDLAFNTAVSFTTNTNWQNYGGEATMSYFNQMAALAFHNWVSAAAGIAIAVALTRGLARRSARSLANFWADMVRHRFRAAGASAGRGSAGTSSRLGIVRLSPPTGKAPRPLCGVACRPRRGVRASQRSAATRTAAAPGHRGASGMYRIDAEPLRLATIRTFGAARDTRRQRVWPTHLTDDRFSTIMWSTQRPAPDSSPTGHGWGRRGAAFYRRPSPYGPRSITAKPRAAMADVAVVPGGMS
jgi:hypothetical protein